MAIPSEYSYISDINTDCYFAGLNFFGADGTGFHDFNESGTVWYLEGTYNTSLCSDSFTDCRSSGNDGTLYMTPWNIIIVRIDTQSYSNVRVSYTSSTGDLSRYPVFGELSLDGKYLCMFERSNTLIEQRFTGTHYHHTESFNSLSDAIDYIYLHWANITLIVDGETWIEAGLNIKTSNGGGATHIAKRTGQLKDLSSNLSDILMVSGGGGGGLLIGDTDYSGKEAGGISGSGDNSADQSTGNAFGQGESGTNVSGGGSGLYGGYKGTSSKSGGAGSGYIGNSLLSNKKMVGYNVPTSSAEGTKTESVNEVSASAVSGKPKSGNGFARIKFLRDIPETLIGKWIDGKNVYEYIVSLTDAVVNDGTIQLFDVSYLNIDTIIQMHGVFQMKSAQENQYAMPSKHYESGYLYDCVDYSEGKIRAKIRYISGGSPLFTIIGTPKIVLRYTKA